MLVDAMICLRDVVLGVDDQRAEGVRYKTFLEERDVLYMMGRSKTYCWRGTDGFGVACEVVLHNGV